MDDVLTDKNYFLSYLIILSILYVRLLRANHFCKYLADIILYYYCIKYIVLIANMIIWVYFIKYLMIWTAWAGWTVCATIHFSQQLTDVFPGMVILSYFRKIQGVNWTGCIREYEY